MKIRYLYMLLIVLIAACMFALLLMDTAHRALRDAPDSGPLIERRDEQGFIETVQGRDRAPVLPARLLEPKRSESEAPPDFVPLDAPAWRVWGYVREPGGDSVPGAKVLLLLQAADSFCYVPFQTSAEPAFTDDRGRYQVQIPLPWNHALFSSSRTITALISGRATAAGHLPSSDPFDAVEHSLSLSRGFETVRLDFEIEPGATLRGIVLDARGEPAARAGVFLWYAGPKPHLEYETETDDVGQYVIPMDQCGRQGLLRVAAAKSGEGVAPALDVFIDSQGDMDLPPLFLCPGEAVEGLLEYPNGRPIRDMEVHAYLAELKDLAVDRLPHPDAVYLSTLLGSAAGLPFGRTRTGPDGRFTIAGLRPGEYFLRIPSPWHVENDQRVFCRAGERSVRFVCKMHVLEITCRDEQGFLIPGGEITVLNDGMHQGACAFGGRARKPVKPGMVSLRGMALDGAVAREELFLGEGDYETRVELVFRHERKPPRLPLSRNR